MLLRQSSSSSKKCAPVTTLNINESKEMKKKKKKQSSRSKSLLQDLNSISRSKSNSSTVSSSISVEAPRGCLRFFRSSTNPYASSSKTVFHNKKPNSLSKIDTNVTPKSAPNPTRPSSKQFASSSRSKHSEKENVLPKPISQKPKKKKPPCLYQWQSGKKPSSENPRKIPKSETLPDLKGNPVNDYSPSGVEDFGHNHLKQKQRCLSRMVHYDDSGESRELLKLSELNSSENVVEDSTPVGKLVCGSVLDCTIDDNQVEEDSNTTGTTKTPPVQASVSPEIQCGSSTLLVSAATPTCYGAGHVLSGVTDRRKCRPRGILTVGDRDSLGCDKVNVIGSDNGGDVIGVTKNSRTSLVPLPAEASMRWLLSQCNENDDGDPDDRLRQCRKLVGSATLDLPSSPSYSHGFASDIRDSAKYSDASLRSATTTCRKTRITLLSPRRLHEFQGFSGSSSDKVVAFSSSASPLARPSCKAVLSQEERKYRYNLAAENSPFSMNSLSSGNVIQTPKSDSSLDSHVGLSWLKADSHQTHKFESEIDSVTEVLHSSSLSPRSRISIWDPPGLSFQFSDLTSPSNSVDLNRLQKTLDNRASWLSNSTLENTTQSQMRISWREGLISRIFEMDELDCCRCLSDEENDADGCSNDQLKSDPSHKSNVENDPFSDNVPRSPEFLDQEPNIIGKGKAKLSPLLSSSCTESICTDGGGLVASGDSDWTLCYKNQLFDV